MTEGLLKGHDILVLTASEWKDNAVSNMHISVLLSETNNVVFVETIGGRLPRLSEFGRLFRRVMRIVRGPQHQSRQGLDPRNVYIFSPFAVPIHDNPLIAWFNRHILVFQIKRLMARRGMKRPIVWFFSPRWLPVIERIDKRLMVFHCVDKLHYYDPSSRFQRQFEAAVRTADVVFTPGILLEEELRVLNANTHRIGHGCVAEHLCFTPNELPNDLAEIPQPQAIFAGALTNWLDYDLLIRVVKAVPEISFVLVGYVHALASRVAVDSLLALPNVYSVGYKNFADLPAYYDAAAVGILPRDTENEHTRYCTPTKFFDYLAAGLPCVSTRFAAAEELKAFIMIADTSEDFAAAIQEAIADDDETKRAARRAYAAEHSWERQVGHMCEAISQILRLRDAGP